MSSIGFNPESVISQSNIEEYYEDNRDDDDAQFFSIANEYNQRKKKMTDFRAMEAMNMAHNFHIKNNPKQLFKTDQVKEKVRKTRSDQEGRQYICGACKSGYLSYPALYTHIKTKHNGVAPEGTIRGKNNNNKKRGRPKSKRKQPQFHYDKEPENVFPKQYMDLVNKTEISNAFDEEEDDQVEQKGQIAMPMFVKEIKQLRKSNLKLCTLPLIKILTIYLHNIKFFLRLEVFETIQLVSSRLIKEINEHYFKILSDFQNQSKFYIRKTLPPAPATKSKHAQTQAPISYCEYENCDYLPVFVHYILKRLDPEDDQIECEFLVDLCNWVYEKKLTSIKLVKSNMIETALVEEEDQ